MAFQAQRAGSASESHNGASMDAGESHNAHVTFSNRTNGNEADAERDPNMSSDGEQAGQVGALLGEPLWSTLEHFGPYFPPECMPHKRLPRSARLVYAGEPIDLPLRAEEIAYAYARVKNHRASRSKRFIANFFDDLNRSLVASDKQPLEKIEDCDFKPMQAHYRAHGKDGKISKRGRKPIRARWCFVDDEKCEVLNYMVEPPGLYMGPEQHLAGRFVRRIRPEDVTINVSSEHESSVVPPQGRWKAVVCDPTQLWTAEYLHPISGVLKHACMATPRQWKGIPRQYVAAHDLSVYLWKFRAEYRKDLRSTVSSRREVAIILWLLDLLGLSLGPSAKAARFDYEFGLESLQRGDVQFVEPSVLEIRFVGVHDLVYVKQVFSPPVTSAALERIFAGLSPNDRVFSDAALSGAKAQLARYHAALSPMCFRVFSFSRALQLAIDEYDSGYLAKYVPASRQDRVIILKRLVRKVSSVIKFMPQVPTDQDERNPKIRLLKWLEFRLKLKLKALNPAVVVDEQAMEADEYYRVGLEYAKANEPRLLSNYEQELGREVASGAIVVGATLTIPNNSADVWDLLYDVVLQIEQERLRIVDPELALEVWQEEAIDPRILVAYVAKHALSQQRVVRNVKRTKWAFGTPATFRY